MYTVGEPAIQVCTEPCAMIVEGSLYIALLCKLTNMKRCVKVVFLVWRSRIHASMLAVEVYICMYTLKLICNTVYAHEFSFIL